MKPELIALDIDGTLTNDQKQITPETLETLLELQKNGTRLVLASARPTPGQYEFAELLHFSENHGILMAYNGGRIVDAASGTTLFETHMELETARKLLRFLESLPVTVILDNGKQFYVTDPNGFKVEYECRCNRMTYTQVENLADSLDFSPVKLLLSVDPDRLFEIQSEIAAHLPDGLTVVRTAPFYLEIIPSSINKGNGLSDLCQMLGIPLSAAAAFGDSENDIPMLRAAGYGVAMGNAEDAVKEAADFVTISNNEDGVAYALKNF